MKKTVIFSMMLAIGAGSFPMAAANTPEVLKTSYFSVFPGKYTKDGKSFLYTYQRNEDDMVDGFHIYDENIKLVKEIGPINLPEYECKYYTQERNYAYEFVETYYDEYLFGDVVEINGVTTGLSIEQVLNYTLALYGHGVIASLPSGVQVVAWTFFEESNYGAKYPISYYREIDGEWMRCEQTYNGINWGPFGEWGEVIEEETNFKVYIESIGLIPESGGDAEYYRLTGGIFGDGYHYIVQTYELRNFEEVYEYNPEWIYRKSWGNRYESTGYVIYDFSGKEVMSFKYPSGYYGGYDLFFFQMGENKYLGIEDVRDTNGDYCLLIYRLENNNSVSFVTAAPSSKVSPRNPKRGEKVSVTIDTPVGNGDAMVQVVSTSGQTMLSKKIPAGQTQLDIDTSGFSQGMYVVTVSGNGVSKEAAKIIVR